MPNSVSRRFRTGGSTGPGTGYSRAGKLENGDTVTLIEERDGWGALLQGGWVSLDYIIDA